MKSSLLIMDGGMGLELLRRDRSGQDSGLWSAQALLDAPELVADVHNDYIAAGARVIITNSYSAIPSYLAKTDLEDRYLELADQAGRIARQVADAAPERVLVAGSIPPLSESYRADLVPADEEAAPIYAALTATLAPYVDVFVCETMSSIREAVNAVSAARSAGGPETPVWVAWTLADEAGQGLRSGESITDAVAALAEYAPDAYLFNCADPDAITAGLEELKGLTDKPIGAYPNGFNIPAGWTLDNEIQAEPRPITPADFVVYAQQWQQQGARIIGGCCSLGPDFISALYKAEQSAA